MWIRLWKIFWIFLFRHLAMFTGFGGVRGYRSTVNKYTEIAYSAGPKYVRSNNKHYFSSAQTRAHSRVIHFCRQPKRFFFISTSHKYRLVVATKNYFAVQQQLCLFFSRCVALPYWVCIFTFSSLLLIKGREFSTQPLIYLCVMQICEKKNATKWKKGKKKIFVIEWNSVFLIIYFV